MTSTVQSHQQTFTASLAQLEHGTDPDLPSDVRSALSAASTLGWIVRVERGAVRRVRVWCGAGSVVSVADQDDRDATTTAQLCTGPTAMAHLVGAWVPGELTSSVEPLAPGTLDQLFSSVVEGDGSAAFGLLVIDDVPERQVIVRSGTDLLIGVVSSKEQLVDLRPLGMAGLWATMSQLTGP